MVTIVAMSDTHNLHNKIDVPDGDILIHAGDFTEIGMAEEIASFNEFLKTLPHRHKIIVPGNHDIGFERSPEKSRALLSGCTFLLDKMVTIEGIKFYGAPWVPWCFGAFNTRSTEEAQEKWQQVPDQIDILVTHGPPHGCLDRVRTNRHVGCKAIRAMVDRVKPRYHIFGHIHEDMGTLHEKNTTFVNVSICSARYGITNPPTILEYPTGRPESNQ